MSKLLTSLFVLVSFFQLSAQVEQIDLTQTKGAFNETNLTVTEGSYQFNIINEGVNHEVGFVLVPKGQYDQSNHIQNAYVKSPVANGSNSMSNIVSLKAGEYEYFCPLNPTPKYSLTVIGKDQTIDFIQAPGIFKTKNLSLKEGKYQFNIINQGVDHEVGFVLVPKGKYDPSNHIQTAYVKAPVANGKSSLTSIVTLEAGEYEYFCPLNPTDKYSLTVTK